MAAVLCRAMPRFVSPCGVITSTMDVAATRSLVGAHETERGQAKSLADERCCDVFINHRGVDTKRSVAGLLYDRLVQLNLRPFLDNRTMEPGDKLYEIINSAVLGCQVGIAIFSPRYCESFYCLHELTMMVESRKKLIPIFCDVKPSSLRLQDDLTHSPETLARFNKALQEAKDTVGLSFDSQSGNWSDLLTRTADIVAKSIKYGNEL
ncbi:hypothetical protein J5N97_027131 [Dioscorea zingiberensis]|uniref:TIR domain-containing protein n=1 Tax=Dioscorea zingiberensis TaxID=325984 RepID=A0A9D5C465_9LILI|nr:hypothetical protein J5N97_027131 [Dioscorea zingiberensis]